MRRLTHLRSILPALACHLLFPCDGIAAEPSVETHHTLWSMKGKTNTVYLLGSVHFLPPDERLPPAVDSAYRDAESLIMEIDMDDLDRTAMQTATLELGTLPSGRTLEMELGAATYAKVIERARTLGIDPQLLNRFRPWLAAMTLAQMQLIKLGLDPNSGVEQRLTAQATRDRKPIAGLETVYEQFAMLAKLPDEQQREFLMYTVEEAARAAQEVEQLIGAWRAGDVPHLTKLLQDGFERYPELYRPLTVDRNQRWLPAIQDLLDDKEDYLVVVGTLHLVGSGSVIELLQRRGHKLTQH